MNKIFFELQQKLDIGNTPLTLLYHNKKTNAKVYVKEEYLNPSGSIKDRASLGMIAGAIADNKLPQGSTIVEATSGNTGIALAYIGSKLNYKVVLTMPDSMSVERRQMLKDYGAQLVLTAGAEGMSGAVARAKQLAQQGAVEVLQFANPNNAMAHYLTTAPEIVSQLDKVDIFVAGVGTGGTLCGCARYFREKGINVSIYAVEPQESAVLSGKPKGAHGIQGIGAGFVPDIVDMTLIDKVCTVNTADAKAMAVTLNKEYNRPCGISSGANVHLAIQLADKTENAGKNIVTVLPDSVNRYRSILEL